MSGVNAVERGSQVQAGSSVEGSTSPSEGGSLLTSPSRVSGRSALMAAQLLLAEARDNSMKTVKSHIEANDQLRGKAIDDAQKAFEEAEKARSHHGGFFSGLMDAVEAVTVDVVKGKSLVSCLDKVVDSTIDSRQFWEDLKSGGLEAAKWAAVAGSIVAAGLSFGAAAPVAALAVTGAILSTASAVEGEFHVLKGMHVSDDWATGIQIGLAVGGAVCGSAGGLASSGTQAASKVVEVAKIGNTVCQGVQAEGQLAQGAGSVMIASFEKRAMNADADAQAATARQAKADREMDRLTTSMKDVFESTQRGLDRVTAAFNDHARASMGMVRA